MCRKSALKNSMDSYCINGRDYSYISGQFLQTLHFRQYSFDLAQTFLSVSYRRFNHVMWTEFHPKIWSIFIKTDWGKLFKRTFETSPSYSIFLIQHFCCWMIKMVREKFGPKSLKTGFVMINDNGMFRCKILWFLCDEVVSYPHFDRYRIWRSVQDGVNRGPMNVTCPFSNHQLPWSKSQRPSFEFFRVAFSFFRSIRSIFRNAVHPIIIEIDCFLQTDVSHRHFRFSPHPLNSFIKKKIFHVFLLHIYMATRQISIG